eukprot:gene9412-biopygen16724
MDDSPLLGARGGGRLKGWLWLRNGEKRNCAAAAAKLQLHAVAFPHVGSHDGARLQIPERGQWTGWVVGPGTEQCPALIVRAWPGDASNSTTTFPRTGWLSRAMGCFF